MALVTSPYPGLFSSIPPSSGDCSNLAVIMIVCSDIELSYTLSFSCNPGRGQLQQTIASIFVLKLFTIVLPISELKRLLVVLTISPTLLYITSLCLLSLNIGFSFLFPFSTISFLSLSLRFSLLVCMSLYVLFYFFLSLMFAIVYSQISDGSFYIVYALGRRCCCCCCFVLLLFVF